jgi:hypothetical protein
MNKDLIKLKLTNLISEEKPKGLVSTEKTQKEEDNINKDYYKEVDKKMGEYDKSSKKEDKNAIEPVKYNYSESDKEIHDEVEIRNGLEMTRYDNEPDEKFKERAEMAIVGDSKMGNKDNSEPTFGGSTKDFAKNLVKTIKKSTKKRNDSITPIVQFGDDVEVLPKDTKKIANKRKVALEGIKRLNYKKEFNGLENAINLIPETYKVDKKVFEMADINETYRIRWEGTVNEGQAIVLKAENKKLVNESMDKIKHLMGFKSSDTSGRLNSAERLAEETNFTKVWDKAKAIIKEGQEMKFGNTNFVFKIKGKDDFGKVKIKDNTYQYEHHFPQVKKGDFMFYYYPSNKSLGIYKVVDEVENNKGSYSYYRGTMLRYDKSPQEFINSTELQNPKLAVELTQMITNIIENNVNEDLDAEYAAKQKEIKDWSKTKNSTDHEAARGLTIANNKNRPKSVQGY